MALFSQNPSPPCTPTASEMRNPHLAPQSFQVLWAHFLLLGIPENGSLPAQASSCLFLRQQSFWPSSL